MGIAFSGLAGNSSGEYKTSGGSGFVYGGSNIKYRVPIAFGGKGLGGLFPKIPFNQPKSTSASAAIAGHWKCE